MIGSEWKFNEYRQLNILLYTEHAVAVVGMVIIDLKVSEVKL